MLSSEVWLSHTSSRPGSNVAMVRVLAKTQYVTDRLRLDRRSDWPPEPDEALPSSVTVEYCNA